MAAAGVEEGTDLDLWQGVSGGRSARGKGGVAAVRRRDARLGGTGSGGRRTGAPQRGPDHQGADPSVASVETACFLQEAPATKLNAAQRDLTLRRVTSHAAFSPQAHKW